MAPVGEGSHAALLSGQRVSEAQVREALIDIKRLETQKNALNDAVKGWVELHGYVRSEDNTKVYCAAQVVGRNKLNDKALEKFLSNHDKTLDDFRVKGNPYTKFDWRNNKND
jgi:hypothetical protein